jgi:hypothetical protein
MDKKDKDLYIKTLEAENQRLEEELQKALKNNGGMMSEINALYMFAEGLEHLATKVALSASNRDVKEYEYIKHEIAVIKQRAFMEIRP